MPTTGHLLKFSPAPSQVHLPPEADPAPSRALGRSRSAPALNGNDCASMGAIANLLILVVRLDLESELAPINLEQLGAHRHLLAFWGGSKC